MSLILTLFGSFIEARSVFRSSRGKIVCYEICKFIGSIVGNILTLPFTDYLPWFNDITSFEEECMTTECKQAGLLIISFFMLY